MTKEEIIEQLNLTIGLIKQDGKNWLDDRDIPILEECVKALSQESCDDAISREDALNGVDAMYNNSWDLRDFRQNVDLMLKELPSVQPSRKGHWIVGSDTDIKGETVYWFTCSECKSDRGQHTNYCPDCGAKMNNTCVEMESSDAT